MNKIYFIISIFFVLTQFAISSSKSNEEINEYDITNIPFELLKDADVVIRKDIQKFEVKDEQNATLAVTYAVTLFRPTEKKYGRLVLDYDKFRSIEDLDGTIYDAKGEEIRTLEKEDVDDYSAVAGYSLYEDDRVKVAELFYDRFPYTIEYKYEMSFDGYLQWPDWTSRNSIEPVEYSSFEVLIPGDQSLRYWTNSDSLQPKFKNLDDSKSYFWEAKNQQKLSSDVYVDDIEDVAAIVKIAPANFVIEDFKGNMSSWKDFGKWAYDLYKSRDLLPESAQKDILAQISSEDIVETQIKKLYKYMQAKTRYVSIQLGIGGWQPLEASYVHSHGYGDCKALSNYMVSILKVVNIKAYPVLIYAGHSSIPLITEFPSNQFNHVVVCVPMEKDTMWLECTSQLREPGSIESEIENRNALLLTSDGGTIVRTPCSKAELNTQMKKINVSLLNGYAAVEAEIKWTGDQQDYVRSVAITETPKEKEEWIKNLFEVPDIRINNSAFTKDEKEISFSGNFSILKYATKSGKRIFFNPNLMERRSYVPRTVKQKLSPKRFYYPYLDIDSVSYVLPEGYKIESLPSELNLQSSFGSFTEKTMPGKAGEIIYSRKLKIDSYEIPAENYDEYKNFFTEIVKADRTQVVLVKEEKN